MKLFAPKTAEKDFVGDMLPHNRKEVFKDVLKLHFKMLLACGLLVFAFMIPLHFTAIWEALVKAQISASLGQKPTLEQISNATLSIISFSNMRGLIDIVGFIVLFIGLSGLARVIKRYAYEENVYFRYDFMEGIRENWLQYSLLGLIVGVLKFVCTYINNTATLAAGHGEVYSYLGLIPTILFSVFLIPTAMYAAVNMSVYKNSFRQNVKIGFALYAKRLWKTILAVICCAVVFIPQMIPNLICLIVGRIVSSVILPFIMLGWWLFAYNGLDDLINPKFAPELVGKGTVPLSEKALADIELRKQLEVQKKEQQKHNKNNSKKK